MSSLLLDLEPAMSEADAHATLRFQPVTQTYLPGRGLAVSLILHEVAFFAVMFLSVVWVRIAPARQSQALSAMDLIHSHEIVYLPTLGGGREGSGSSGAGRGGIPRGNPEVPAQTSKGLSYPGPQRIISDPPRATNQSQTLLRPALVNPPVLKLPAPLPNLVQMANTAPLIPPAPVQPIRVSRHAETIPNHAQPTVAAPRLTLPASNSSVSQLLTQDVKPAPTLNVAPPPPVEISQVSLSGPDRQNVIALSAVPPPPQMPAAVPNAEARGRFAISPEAGLAPAAPTPGSPLGAASVSTTGMGTAGEGPTGNALGGELGTGSARGSSGSGEGGVTGRGVGRGNSYGGGTGSGNGAAGSSLGSGAGAGAGSGTGSGTGTGSGPGAGAFPGITIQGAQNVTGAGGRIIPSLTPPVHSTYNMTIVSTPSSGGGLPDFGVFYNEKIYTVYIDMKSSEAPRAPSWILQYALIRDTGSPATRAPGSVTAPYAVSKELPNLVPEVEKEFGHALIVISAILDATGRLSQIRLRQPADVRLIKPITDAMSQWIFVPAELNGEAVPIKILLGIRLSQSTAKTNDHR